MKWPEMGYIMWTNLQCIVKAFLLWLILYKLPANDLLYTKVAFHLLLIYPLFV